MILASPIQISTLRSEITAAIANLEDYDTLLQIRSMIEEGGDADKDWWDDLDEDQRQLVTEGEADVAAGRTVSSEEMREDVFGAPKL